MKTSDQKLFNPSQFDRDTAFPPIFVKELEYKCSQRGDEMLGNWENKCLAFRRTNVRRLEEQKFGGNIPQPTRKLRSRTKYLEDILENPLNLYKLIIFRFQVPFNAGNEFGTLGTI